MVSRHHKLLVMCCDTVDENSIFAIDKTAFIVLGWSDFWH